MKDLYRCLEDHPVPLLQAIADSWHVLLPTEGTKEMVPVLAEAMLAPHALETLLAGLSPVVREALGAIARGGGTSPTHRLLPAFGALRRFGPARMEREQPWNQPANPLEELYYRGLIYRAYDTVDDYHGEVLLIPQQLMERLAEPSLLQDALGVAQAEPPSLVRSDGNALVEDLLAILVRMRRGAMLISRSDGDHASTALSPSIFDLGPRLQGERDPLRLALLGRLLVRLRLTQRDGNLLRPSSRARDWLRLPHGPRTLGVFLAWREDPRWDELRHLPSLQAGDLPTPRAPMPARCRLLRVLAQCQTGTWLPLESFLRTLKRQRPDYLRPDGDYTRPVFRDAETGVQLSGFEAWDRVEGALASHIICTSLRWLGAVDVGYRADVEAPSSFRITPQGEEMLSERTEAPGTAVPRPVAVVTDDFVVTIPTENALYERYQLERFAEWRSQDTNAVYHITAESIWESQNAGIRSEQILRFLQHVSGGHVPSSVERALQEWGKRVGRVIIRKMVLLQTVDERTMQQIRSTPAVRSLLGQALSPTACLVDEANVEELSKRLKLLGIWPHIRI